MGGFFKAQIAPVSEAGDPAAILSAIDAVAYDWDIAGDRVAWGPNVGAVLRGLPESALATGAGFAVHVAADSLSSRYQAVFGDLGADLGEGAPFRARYRLRAAEGGTLEIEDFGRWFADADGRPARVRGVVRVTGRAAEGEAADTEAGLGARRAFAAFVDRRCAEPRSPDTQLALLMVGIGNLSEINAREGYDVGDELIEAVGRRLAGSLRGGDRLVRYCGGKFALLMALTANDQPAVAAARIARRANAELYTTSRGPMRATTRAGVALSPRHGRHAHLLLQRADEAYGQACAAAEPVCVFAVDEALSETRRRDAWVADEIVAALNDRRLFLAFQPIVSHDPALPDFEEALMRLRLDDGAVLGPDAVLPVAERVGLIEMIDDRVLELAVARLAEEPACRLSMNVSVSTLRASGWFERLRDRLDAAPGAAERLIVEIVETQAVENVEEVAGVLALVKSLGVRVAMDDFGAGHTSFRNLRHLGVDIVKIDGAFVQSLATSADDRFFVRTLAALARHLGLVTVAEWVEDAETARLLKEWGVDYLQGHFVAPAAFPSARRERATA